MNAKSIHAFMKDATAKEFWEYTLKRNDDAEWYLFPHHIPSSANL